MTTKRCKQDYRSTAIRLPPEVHAAVHEAARAQERSFNGQVVATLRAALLPEGKAQPAEGAAQ